MPKIPHIRHEMRKPRRAAHIKNYDSGVRAGRRLEG